jgi:DNA-3-methyladenine glycosylase II
MNGVSASAGLDTAEAIALALGELAQRDPRLGAVIARAGAVEPRLNPRGFAGMAKVVCGQQLSVASARAIWSRFEMLPGAVDPAGFLALDPQLVRASGFSAGKIATLRVVAEAMASGALDFAHLETLPADEAIAYLTVHKGIGPWTAEIYLMFCARHPDVFPSGDLALQKAVAHALDLPGRPAAATLAELATPWSPHRSVAALLFWRYFAAVREREGIVL